MALKKLGVDIPESWILKKYPLAFAQLLADKTTGGNIRWLTNDYERFSETTGTLAICDYGENDEMTAQAVIGVRSRDRIIMPRCSKSKLTQDARTKNKAEVFTPLWVCRAQNDLIDKAFFGRKNTFFKDRFPPRKPHDYYSLKTINPPRRNENPLWWQEYILLNRLEVACGEAPYLVTRYDSTTNKAISALKMRVGLLDRKMILVNEFCKTESEWMEWTFKAFQSIYGFEWQGDNLLIARENLLFTFYDNFVAVFKKEPDDEQMSKIAEIVAWNVFQMDGEKLVVPNSCNKVPVEVDDEDLSLPLEGEVCGNGEKLMASCPGCEKNDIRRHNGIRPIVKDWGAGTEKSFYQIFMEENQDE